MLLSVSFAPASQFWYHTNMASRSSRTVFVNVLGTLGYISVIFQWLWSVVTVAYPFLSSDMSYIFPVAQTPAAPAPTAPPSPFAIGLVIVLTVIIFIFTLYVLWKLPGAIGKRGGQTTKRAAEALMPVITRRKPVAKKERRRISRRLVLIIKGLIVLIPLAALVFANPVGELSREIIWIVGLFCAGCSSLYFSIQQLAVKLWKLPPEQIW